MNTEELAKKLIDAGLIKEDFVNDNSKATNQLLHKLFVILFEYEIKKRN